MHLTFKNPSNPFQIVNIGKISDSYSISFVTSTTLDNYIVPAQFLDGHLDQDYFGYPFLKGFVRGFISSQIPPTVNTDNKSELVGVVDSEGEALLPYQTDFTELESEEYKKFVNKKVDELFFNPCMGGYSPLICLFDHDEIYIIEWVFRDVIHNMRNKKMLGFLDEDDKEIFTRIKSFVDFHNLDVAF